MVINKGEYNISLIEQICKSRPEDEEEHFDEWGKKIPGKKYGYIYIEDILKDYYYTSDEKKESNKIYRLNLLPEKYFRPTKFENLDYSQLVNFRKQIEEEINQLLRGDRDA